MEGKRECPCNAIVNMSLVGTNLGGRYISMVGP